MAPIPGNQLQLPQRPTPPGLPKPVPARVQVQEPYKPKIIPGKVALCPNCGGYSVDISKCTGCRKIIKEGAKILPDPDYKPPVDAEKKDKTPQDLRHIRIQPKQRRKTANDEPEWIALSSDEEGHDEEKEENPDNSTESNGNAEVNNKGDGCEENSQKSSETKAASGKTIFEFLGLVALFRSKHCNTLF